MQQLNVVVFLVVDVLQPLQPGNRIVVLGLPLVTLPSRLTQFASELPPLKPELLLQLFLLV